MPTSARRREVLQAQLAVGDEAAAPGGNRTTSQSSAASDTRGARRMTIHLNIGAVTDGTYNSR